VVAILFLVKDALGDGMRVHDAAAALVDALLQEHRVLVRLPDAVGRDADGFLPGSDTVRLVSTHESLLCSNCTLQRRRASDNRVKDGIMDYLMVLATYVCGLSGKRERMSSPIRLREGFKGQIRYVIPRPILDSLKTNPLLHQLLP